MLSALPPTSKSGDQFPPVFNIKLLVPELDRSRYSRTSSANLGHGGCFVSHESSRPSTAPGATLVRSTRQLRLDTMTVASPPSARGNLPEGQVFMSTFPVMESPRSSSEIGIAAPSARSYVVKHAWEPNSPRITSARTNSTRSGSTSSRRPLSRESSKRVDNEIAPHSARQHHGGSISHSGEDLSARFQRPSTARPQSFVHASTCDISEIKVKFNIRNKPSLLHAVLEDHLPTVMHIFENYESVVRIDSADADGYTALLLAVSNGNIPMVGYLISKGANIHACEYHQHWNALHIAAKNGNLSMVIILVREGADLTSVDCYGNTALHIATSAGHSSVIEFLVKKEQSLLEITNERRETPLFEAVSNGHLHIVDLLLSKGANIMARTKVSQSIGTQISRL
jgi:ankyrin repeat protein